MKSNTPLIIFIILLFLLVAFSCDKTCGGESIKADSAMVIWKSRVDSDGSGFYSIPGCKIFSPGNRGFIQILAVVKWKEDGKGYVLEQTIIIREEEKGKKSLQESRYLFNPKTLLYTKAKGGYDVFRKTYYPLIENSKGLPDTVKTVLKEIYGKSL